MKSVSSKTVFDPSMQHFMTVKISRETSFTFSQTSVTFTSSCESSSLGTDIGVPERTTTALFTRLTALLEIELTFVCFVGTVLHLGRRLDFRTVKLGMI